MKLAAQSRIEGLSEMVKGHSTWPYGGCHQGKMISCLDINCTTLVTADLLLRCPVLHCASLQKPHPMTSGLYVRHKVGM